jgi:hypothetical protein
MFFKSSTIKGEMFFFWNEIIAKSCLSGFTGAAKSPIRFEKRVYLSKPTLNLLKTWFSSDKPAKMSSRPGL